MTANLDLIIGYVTLLEITKSRFAVIHLFFSPAIQRFSVGKCLTVSIFQKKINIALLQYRYYPLRQQPTNEECDVVLKKNGVQIHIPFTIVFVTSLLT